MVWLTGWNYRKSHVLSGSSDGAQTNYQVGIKVYYGSGTDGTETVDGITFGKVYCSSKCKTDFGDIRFTDSSGTLYDYYVKEQSNSSYAIIWVKISSIPASPSTLIFYLYYGNTSATTLSTRNAVILHERWDGSYDETWNVESGTWSIYDNSVYRESSYTSGGKKSHCYKTLPSSIYFTIDMYFESDVNYGAKVEIPNDTYIVVVQLFPASNQLSFYCNTHSYSSYSVLSSTWYTMICTLDSAIKVGKVTVGSTTVTHNNAYITNGTALTLMSEKTRCRFDNFFCRKFTTNEPSHSTWGTEEAFKLSVGNIAVLMSTLGLI